MDETSDRYASFPDGFFDRSDDTDDAVFYGPPRLVTHIDDHAISAVGELYDELRIGGDVLDLMSSWISHFRTPPAALTVLGMNQAELDQNQDARANVVHDLNAEPTLPFDDASFDDVVCCVSVDYLTRPIEVFADVGRVLQPGGRFVCTFSNRCFPTKVMRGWLALSEPQRMDLVGLYFDLSGPFGPVTKQLRPTPPGADPLYAVWAQVV